MKPRLIIINQSQFGYHTDSYYWAKYLNNSFRINYICWDYNRPKNHISGVNITYISRSGNIIIRNFRFIYSVLRNLQKYKYDIHIIKYFRGCSILSFFYPTSKLLLDIRTGSASPKKTSRFVYNFFLKLESLFFRNISVISESLKKKLRLPNDSYILPLGAEPLSENSKPINSMKLLYVGVLSYRDIDKTIKGFAKFYHEHKNKIKIKYTIVGGGYNDEEQLLKELCQHEKVTEVTKILGPIPHEKIKPFFESHNIGVSYIPKTDFFDVQPPTKTFEYLLSGMPVIATSTTENAKVINVSNGVLINDDSNSFYDGIKQVFIAKNEYNPDQIKKEAKKHSWYKIVKNLKLHLDKTLISEKLKFS